MSHKHHCSGDTVNLRFNPTNDAVNSVFISGNIKPCTLPIITPTVAPLPTPTPPPPTPVPGATAFMSCLLSQGFKIKEIVELTPTDVLATLVRCKKRK